MSTPVMIEIDGETLQGAYDVRGDRILVQYQSRSMTRQIGSQPPETMAKKVLAELARIVRDLQHAA